MEKVFFIGDNESLIAEVSELLDSKFEIANELDETVDYVFELTNFNKEIKFNILNFIDEKNTTAVVISASLCIPVYEQAENTKYPERIVGAGIYNSFCEMKGIELSKCKLTGDKHFQKVINLFESLDKEVHVVTDRVGMISMRIISMIINEAYLVLQEGTSNKEDIDIAMKLGTNYPHGPIEWSQKIGVELIYNVLRSMNKEFGDDRYRITPMLKEQL